MGKSPESQDGAYLASNVKEAKNTVLEYSKRIRGTSVEQDYTQRIQRQLPGSIGEFTKDKSENKEQFNGKSQIPVVK